MTAVKRTPTKVLWLSFPDFICMYGQGLNNLTSHKWIGHACLFPRTDRKLSMWYAFHYSLNTYINLCVFPILRAITVTSLAWTLTPLFMCFLFTSDPLPCNIATSGTLHITTDDHSWTILVHSTIIILLPCVCIITALLKVFGSESKMKLLNL